MGVNETCRIIFRDGTSIECSLNHAFYTAAGEIVTAESLVSGQRLQADPIPLDVVGVERTGRHTTYSLVEVSDNHRYYTNSVVSKNCDFVSDDETLINPLVLSRIRASSPISYTGTVRWYHDPEPNHTYLVALDPAMGTQNDYGAIEVFQMPEMIQVAEWQNNDVTARHQVRTMLEILTEIDAMLQEHPDQIGDPDIYWTFENNTLGEGVLTIIEDTHEDRFPGSLVTERGRKGLQMR